MSFQWLKMRIGEEKERRERETNILNRLPVALEQLRAELVGCIDEYNAAFGASCAVIESDGEGYQIIANDTRVGIALDELLPGFVVEQDSGRLPIEIGILPGGNLFYRDAEKYLTIEEMTRRILDRALFPKLKD
jgi:hypothetical protein